MRTRSLFLASMCLLAATCLSHAAGPATSSCEPACRNIAIPDIIPILPSEIAPDRVARIVPVTPSEIAPDGVARIVPVPPSVVAPERPCGVAAHRCAISAAEWAIFPDSRPGTPDFWRTPSVEVREIIRCGHGIQFLFPAVQDGQPRLAALAFPVPTVELLATRLGLARGSARMDAEIAHYRERYARLLGILGALPGSPAGEARRELAPGPGRPRILPMLLVLDWGEGRQMLRGYLDVYFTAPESESVVAVAGHPDAGAPSTSVVLAAAASSSAPDLVVAPNPGGAAGYTLSFALPAAGPAALRIFDVAGRRVATLLEGERPAGSARLRWDGRSAGGRPAGAGVYFARLDTAAGSRTVKLVHLAR